MSEEEFEPGVLNLAGADTRGFTPIPAGTEVIARVERAEWQKTKGGDDAKMPQGTPMLNVAFVVDEGEYEGRWVWNKYPIPPDEYDEQKRNRMRGSFVRFVTAAMGVSEDEVTSGSYSLDLEELTDGDKRVSLKVGIGKPPYDDQNTVRNITPVGQAQTTESGLL